MLCWFKLRLLGMIAAGERRGPGTPLASGEPSIYIDVNILDINTMCQQKMPRGRMQMQNTSGVHIWLVLAKAFHALAAQAEQSLNLSETGLGDSDFRVLEVLLSKGPLPVNTIGPKVWLTPGSISVAVDRLEKKRLVKRQTTDARRVRLVELTAKGRELIAKTFERHAAAMEKANTLSKEERLNLLQLLRKSGKGGV